jgi:hypothetical protein
VPEDIGQGKKLDELNPEQLLARARSLEKANIRYLQSTARAEIPVEAPKEKRPKDVAAVVDKICAEFTKEKIDTDYQLSQLLWKHMRELSITLQPKLDKWEPEEE